MANAAGQSATAEVAAAVVRLQPRLAGCYHDSPAHNSSSSTAAWHPHFTDRSQLVTTSPVDMKLSRATSGGLGASPCALCCGDAAVYGRLFGQPLQSTLWQPAVDALIAQLVRRGPEAFGLRRAEMGVQLGVLLPSFDDALGAGMPRSQLFVEGGARCDGHNTVCATALDTTWRSDMG